MHISRTTDPELRKQLATLHQRITEARAMTGDLIAAGLDLTWADACLSDADRDVTGIFNNSQPMSFR